MNNPIDNDVRALRSELELFRQQFLDRIDRFEQRLDIIAERSAKSEIIEPAPEKSKPTTSVNANSYTPPSYTQLGHAAPELNASSDKKPATEELVFDLNIEPAAKQSQQQAKQPTSSGYLQTLLTIILSALFEWLEPVNTLYQSYKSRGMLGIFTLTIVGIGLTLAGFGYLMQLLIDQLGAGTKSLLMACVAAAVMALGIGLKIKTRYGEFSTAIVTLGILFAYSTVYFSGSVYHLLPNFLVLILYLAIAIMCHAIARLLDTNVVASLGILGIATMPILSNTVQFESSYYLLSLAFVCASSLILAHRYTGPWLASFSLACCVVALEWTLGFELANIPVGLINVFYLMFFGYLAITLLNNSDPDNEKHQQIKKTALILLATLVGATILLFFQAGQFSSLAMSLGFLVNAIAAAGLAIFFYKIRQTLTHLLVLLASLWTVLAIISSFSSAYWGIAWAVEGLLLLYMAKKYCMPAVIHQAQILVATALVYCFAALAPYFPLPALINSDGWVLSLVIVATIALWQRAISEENFNAYSLKRIKPSLQLLEAVWLAFLVLGCGYIWLGAWSGALIIFLQLALLFRAKHCKQVSIEYFAAALIAAPLFCVYYGSITFGSYRFTQLPSYAQLAVISAFAQLWLWSAFYRQYQPDSKIINIAEAARILFYALIPICWVGSAIRKFDENALMFLWLSPLLALFFAAKIKHHLLIKEAKFLTVAATLSLIISLAWLGLVESLAALAGFAALYGCAYFIHRKQISENLTQFICSWGLIGLGVSIPIIITTQTATQFAGLLSAAIFWSVCFYCRSFSIHLSRNELLITTGCALLMLASWAMTPVEYYYASVAAVILAVAVYHKTINFSDSLLAKRLGDYSDLLLHSMAAVTYSLLLAALANHNFDLLIGPALAVHGALVLFIKDKRLITVKFCFALIALGILKLAALDAANALLWQKVILFMGVGVFILAASFWYQKLLKNTAE